ncbi:MAG TPA: SCO family protein [Bryobacteraceae bacterium]|nr:SCO family protein [Bryobacteraceae bacterium]
MKLFSLCLLLLLSAPSLNAQYGRRVVNKEGVGIDQKLNTSIPLDLVFRDELNRPVPLRTYFGDKPVVLALVYYKCPSLCGLTMSEMVHSLGQVSLTPQKDYKVVIVSIDPAEKPPLAAAKKASYGKLFAKPSFDAGWHFLTGDQDSISRLAAAVGFRYRWDEPTHQFVHAAGIMVATPEGKLSRYFYGIQYTPTDVRLSLVEASAHKIGSPVDYVLLFCCPYDPLTGKYTVAIYNVLKLAGGVTLLCLGILVFFLVRSGKKRKSEPVPRAETVHG